MKLTEESSQQKTLDLDPLPTKLLHCEDGHVVPRDESEGSDDDVSGRDVEKFLPGGTGLASEADFLKYYVLVQVDTVESAQAITSVRQNNATTQRIKYARNVEEEPA